MRKLGITQGEAIVEKRYDKLHKQEVCDVSMDGTIDGVVTCWSFFIERECESNAELIADAFNTANKCDMLPSELLEQRDELMNKNIELVNALDLIISTKGNIAVNDPIWVNASILLKSYD